MARTEARRKTDRLYRETHGEKIAAYRKANGERQKLYDAKYCVGHRKEVAAKKRDWACRNKDRMRAAEARYRARYPEKHVESQRTGRHRRRARMRGAEGRFGAADIAIMLRNQKGRCWWCGKPMKRHTVDHRFALTRAGTNDPSNLVLACGPCNRRKWTRTPQEFCGRLF